MSRLPNPGGDAGRWGDILNDYLLVGHNADGTLKNALSTSQRGAANGVAELDGSGKLPVSRLPASAATGSMSVSFVQPVAAIGTSHRWTAAANGSLQGARLSCVAGPIGSALTVSVRRNGTGVISLTIANGANADTVTSSSLAFVAGDKFDVQASSVGSGTAATGVAVQLDYMYS